jgi:hypothetical protein
MNRPMDRNARIGALLSRAGVSSPLVSVNALAAGGNNRIWHIVAGTTPYVVKEYFRHACDQRDRLRAEYDFLEYAVVAAPSRTPGPLARDDEDGLALYEFVSGNPFAVGTLTKDDIDAAADFFAALNRPTFRHQAQLGEASEACFSVQEHLALIDRRLKSLSSMEMHVPEDTEASALVAAIGTEWGCIRERTLAETLARPALKAPLPADQRCISPSDFGFHNALREAGGAIKFIDFEYAGWDDPAKMAGDFFAQLAIPVSAEFFGDFVEACMSPFPEPQDLVTRACMLRPAYQIKWCCIALNVFLPVNLARRRFAHPNLDERTVKQAQLAKASRLLQAIVSENHGLH